MLNSLFKYLRIFLVLIVFLSFNVPLANADFKVIDQNACRDAYRGKFGAQSIDMPTRAEIGKDLQIKVTFFKDAPKDKPYYIRMIPTGPRGRGWENPLQIGRVYSKPVTLRNTNEEQTITFEIAGKDVMDKLYDVDLVNNAGSTRFSDDEVCTLGQIQGYDPHNLTSTTCTIIAPDNVKSGTSFPISINFQNPPGQDIQFNLLLIRAQTVPLKQVLQTQGFTETPIFTYPVSPALIQQRPITYSNDGTNNQPKLLNGNYLFLAQAKKNNGAVAVGPGTSAIDYRYYYCDIKPFQVSFDNMSAPTTGEAAKSTNDTTKLIGGNNQTVKTSPVPAGGTPCGENGTGILTAIGCVRTDPVGLVQDFFRLAVGIGGGIALLLMVAGAFQMVSSAGNPDAVKHGKERFTSAIEGLLFLIFSILLLRIIGVDILGLGKFLGV